MVKNFRSPFFKVPTMMGTVFLFSMQLIIYSDGGSRGNPGKSGIGVVIKNDTHQLVKKLWKYLGVCTNNVAEYHALLLGIEEALLLKPEKITCYLDSELVVKQLNGQYRVKHPDLQPLYQKIRTLVMFQPVTFIHIPRERNQEADRLANKAMDEQSEGNEQFL